MKLNKIEVNQITNYSNLNDIALALVGKFAKYQDNGFRYTILKDICFIHTFTDNKIDIELPQHYPFRFDDNSGKHIVNEDDNTISINGVTFFSFILKYK